MDYFTVLAVQDPATVASAFVQFDKDTKKMGTGVLTPEDGMRGGVTIMACSKMSFHEKKLSILRLL